MHRRLVSAVALLCAAGASIATSPVEYRPVHGEAQVAFPLEEEATHAWRLDLAPTADALPADEPYTSSASISLSVELPRSDRHEQWSSGDVDTGFDTGGAALPEEARVRLRVYDGDLLLAVDDATAWQEGQHLNLYAYLDQPLGDCVPGTACERSYRVEVTWEGAELDVYGRMQASADVYWDWSEPAWTAALDVALTHLGPLEDCDGGLCAPDDDDVDPGEEDPDDDVDPGEEDPDAGEGYDPGGEEPGDYDDGDLGEPGGEEPGDYEDVDLGEPGDGDLDEAWTDDTGVLIFCSTGCNTSPAPSGGLLVALAALALGVRRRAS